MSYKISIHHSQSVHQSGTKYYALVLIDIFDLNSNDRFSRLYRIYGSTEKRTINWKCDVDSSDHYTKGNAATEEFNKLVKSKSKSGYTDLMTIKRFEYEEWRGLLGFCDKTGIIPHSNKSLSDCIGATETEGLIDYCESINDGLVLDTKAPDDEEIKKIQEALNLELHQQRLEHYGDTLGSW